MPNLKLSNRNLSVLNQELLEGQPVAHLTADTASGSGTLVLDHVAGFTQPTAADRYVLIGNFGEPTAEIVKLHATTAPSGKTVTLAANTVNDHYVDTPVTVIQYNQAEFSHAATTTGTKDGVTARDLDANGLYTVYNDITNTTGYAFARFKNSTSTTYTAYSSAVPYSTGNTYDSFEAIATEACSKAGTSIGDEYSKAEQLLRDANEAQTLVCQTQDWSFELVKADTAITSTQDENTYALSSLTYPLKRPQTYQSILNVRFGSGLLSYIDPDDMDREYEGATRAALNASVLAGATSFTVADSYELAAANGTLKAGANTITYTLNTKSTGTLSGVSGVTYAMSDGASVWQGKNTGKPAKYTVFAGDFIVNAPVSSTEAGKKFKFRYLKRIARLTDFASVTEIPFFESLEYFIAAKIALRKGNMEQHGAFMALFKEVVASNMETYKLPMLEEETYHTFDRNDVLGNYDVYGSESY